MLNLFLFLLIINYLLVPIDNLNIYNILINVFAIKITVYYLLRSIEMELY